MNKHLTFIASLAFATAGIAFAAELPRSRTS